MRKIYIAGPMTGYEKANFPSFDEAEARLKELGWLVINPANLDRIHWGFPLYPPKGLLESLYGEDMFAFRKSCIRRDVNALLEFNEGDAIFLLKGWKKSIGALGELGIANWIGLETLFEKDGYEEA